MSLNYELGGIKDWRNVCFIHAAEDRPMDGIKRGERITNPVTTSLIWATMAVGIGQLTEKNALEFWQRLRLVETLNGSFLSDADGSVLITLEDVRRHIGLRTNVTAESASSWRKRMIDNWTREQTYREQHYEQPRRRALRFEAMQPALVEEFGAAGATIGG